MAVTPLSESIRAAIEADPKYAPWPPTYLASRSVGVASIDDTTLVLLRMKLVFDFASGIDAVSSADLTEAIDVTWPRVAELRLAMRQGSGVGPYAQAAVFAHVTAGGDPTWGFDENVRGGLPIPVTGLTRDGSRLEYDRFVQNAVRLDLQQRIEARLA